MIKTLGVYNLEKALASAGLPMCLHIDALKASEGRGKKLGHAPVGSGHDKYLRGIMVSFRIQAPRYFYQQLDTYHFVESVSSQSTMHCVDEFNLNTMLTPATDQIIATRFKQLVQMYKDGRVPLSVVKASLPEGLMLYRDCVTNYQQLKTIYKQRRNHRLTEWQEFCDWIETLPMFKELVLDEIG